MNSSMFLDEDASRAAGGNGPPQGARIVATRDASFSDLARMTDPDLVDRRHRLRRIVGGVMAGALLLLVVAGICGIFRRSRVTEPASSSASRAAIASVVPSVEPLTGSAGEVRPLTGSPGDPTVPPEAPVPPAEMAVADSPAPSTVAETIDPPPAPVRAASPKPHRTKAVPARSPRKAIGPHAR